MADLLARRAAGHPSVAAYVARVEASDPVELRALIQEVTVGETYFFRHAEQFQAYADLLPALVARHGVVRVLSAGCSTGEEPYTLAMLARERVADRGAVQVHAFDLNPVALERAARARYSRWALRATLRGAGAALVRRARHRPRGRARDPARGHVRRGQPADRWRPWTASAGT